MLGDMEGKGRKGRPCREWLNDIEEWCGKYICFHNRESQDPERNGGQGEMVRGHPQTFYPWILMMMIMSCKYVYMSRRHFVYMQMTN